MSSCTAGERDAPAFGDSSRAGGADLTSADRFSVRDLPFVLALVAVAMAAIALTRPAGEFPLNDDWAYILPVHWLVDRGQLRFTDWQYMTLVGQVALGALVASVTGFSITGLRWFVLALAVLSIVLVYAIARLTRASRLSALLAALLLLCNPIFLLMSASFMTDTPFVATSLIAIYFFLLWQRDSRKWIGVLAWTFVIIACSIRQSGLMLALGFVAFSLARSGVSRKTLATAVVPAGLVVTLLAAYPMVIERTIGLPTMFNETTDEMTAFLVGLVHMHLGFLWMAAKTLFLALFYLGFCLVPLLPLVPAVARRGADRRALFAFAAACIAAAAVTMALAATGRARPLSVNTLFDFGIGQRSLPSAVPAAAAPASFWWVMTFVAALGALTVLRSVSKVDPDRAVGRADFVMLVTMLLCYNLPFLTRGGIWFDRYTIPNVVLFGLLIAPALDAGRRRPAAWALAVTLAAAYLAFSVAGTHDYLEWNRQRWAAAAELGRGGVPSGNIDGGFEYNNYEARVEGDHRRKRPEPVNIENPNAPYRLAFSPLPRHLVLKVWPCRTWLYGSPNAIYVLRSTGAPP